MELPGIEPASKIGVTCGNAEFDYANRRNRRPCRLPDHYHSTAHDQVHEPHHGHRALDYRFYDGGRHEILNEGERIVSSGRSGTG